MNNEFYPSELIPFTAVSVILAIIIFSNYFKSYKELWSPLTIIAFVLAYYCLLGPYFAVDSGETVERSKQMRPYYSSAFWGTLIFLISCLIGFNIHSSKRTAPIPIGDDILLFRYGKNISFIGLILFTISTGGNIAKLINPLDAEAVEQQGGSFANYLSLSLLFLVSGVSLLLVHYLKTKKKLIWFVSLGLLAMALYTTLGFRFRIVLLLGSVTITYYLFTHKKPNLILATIGIWIFINLMGLIGSTRQYGAGLDLSKLDKKGAQSNIKSSFNESKIFGTSGAVIDYVPNRIPYAGLAPITSTILFPIPRLIYPEKNSAGYILNAINTIYGTKRAVGSAFLVYAEYYLAFGWIGIFIGGFIWGWVYKKLWVWYLSNEDNPFVIVAYASSVIYLFMVISRGYLPLTVTLFFFSAYPAFYVIRLIKKNAVAIKNKFAEQLEV